MTNQEAVDLLKSYVTSGQYTLNQLKNATIQQIRNVIGSIADPYRDSQIEAVRQQAVNQLEIEERQQAILDIKNGILALYPDAEFMSCTDYRGLVITIFCQGLPELVY